MTSSILHHVCGTNPAKGLFTRLIAQSEPVKRCTKCGESKAVALFSKYKNNKDGLQRYCKLCHDFANRMLAQKNQMALAATKNCLVEKACTKCLNIKGVAEFSKKNTTKDGFQHHCKSCVSRYKADNKDKLAAAMRLYLAENQQKIKAYRDANKEQFLARDAKYRADNKIAIAARNAAWHAKNKAEIAIRQKAYLLANKEKRASYKSAYDAANKERISKRVYEYRLKNKAKISASSKAYRTQNIDNFRVYCQNRRAISRSSGTISKNITQLLMQEQGNKCACCLTDLSVSGHHLDHVMPLSLGGHNVDSNMQLLCPTCNVSKGAKHPLAWMAAKGIFSANP
jgi:5-methylcytosine-specific restriction endonuclease McrA